MILRPYQLDACAAVEAAESQGAPGFVMKNNGSDHEPVPSEMRCPSCDAVVAALDSPDISPAIGRCPSCGYSETEKMDG